MPAAQYFRVNIVYNGVTKNCLRFDGFNLEGMEQ